MVYEAIFFDLDETLYPVGNQVVSILMDRMNQYIEESLKIPRDEVAAFRENLYHIYGTTAKGLVTDYDTDLYQFLHYVHKIDIASYIEPAPELRRMLLRIPLEKYILTNADRFHSARVLKTLGIYDCFDGMIDVLDVFPDCKPSEKAFRKALLMTGISEPNRCIFLDDKPENIDAAHNVGLYAVHVGGQGSPAQADASIEKIEDLPSLNLYPEIKL